MITIDVFPDSGHHYTFVPLLSEALQKHPQFKQLCQSGRQPWREVNHPWIRARFAMKDGQPVPAWIDVPIGFYNQRHQAAQAVIAPGRTNGS